MRLPSRWTCALPALVVALLALWSTSASAFSLHANFAPLPSPCAAGKNIAGFAVSGRTWLALCRSASSPRTNGLRRSADGGVTWTDVPFALPDGEQGGPATGPDGSFALVQVKGSATELDRIDAATGAAATAPGPPVPADLIFTTTTPPAWSAGRALVAVTGFRRGAGPEVTVYRQSPDGSWTVLGVQAWAGGISGDAGFVDVAGVTYYRDDNHVFELTPSGLTPVAGLPLHLAGVTNTPDGLSLDGGATTVLRESVTPVEGDPATFLVGQDVVQPFGAFVLGATGMRLPDGTSRVLRVAGGYVAVATGAGFNAVAFAPDGPLPGLSPTFERWLARANALRAEAGFSPMIGDPAISRAAENHSRYWTLNPAPSAVLNYHDEVTGRPGFTGESMVERCAATGARCESEIMFPGVSQPIEGWAATVYHRGLLLDPTSASAGGGLVGDGPAVMDGGPKSGLLIAPTGFPRGDYTGPLDFSGEAPDPAVSCKKKGQPVGKPFGAVVTAWAPSGSLTDLNVRERGGAALSGCRLENWFAQAGEQLAPTLHFLPAAPLARHTTYDVTAQWHPTGSTASQPVAWSFTAAGAGASGSGRCRVTLRLLARAVRRGRALKIRYRACGRGWLIVRISRKSKAPLRKALRVRGRKGTYAIKTARLAPGRYALTVKLGRVHQRYRVRVKPRQHR